MGDIRRPWRQRATHTFTFTASLNPLSCQKIHTHKTFRFFNTTLHMAEWLIQSIAVKCNREKWFSSDFNYETRLYWRYCFWRIVICNAYRKNVLLIWIGMLNIIKMIVNIRNVKLSLGQLIRLRLDWMWHYRQHLKWHQLVNN